MLMRLAFRFGIVTTNCASFMSISQSVSYSDVYLLNLFNPLEVGFYDTPGGARDVVTDVVSGEGFYAYVADGDKGLRIINYNNFATPKVSEVGALDTPGNAVAVARHRRVSDLDHIPPIISMYALVADGSTGLHIYDVSNPANPLEVDGYDPTIGSVRNIAIAGNYAYLAAEDAGMRIINISGSLIETGFYDTPDYASDVAVAGNYAYVADGSNGLRIINITDPGNPAEVGFYDTPGFARGVAVAGDYAYVADYNNGLRIINITNPASPTEVGFYDTPGLAYSVTVGEGFAYVADGGGGLRIISIADPAAPIEVGFQDTSWSAYAVRVVVNSHDIVRGFLPKF